MPRTISRRRTIDAPPRDVWTVVSDPHHLPRWWPATARVENVRMTDGLRRSQWTQVLETEKGKGVRADFRCTAATSGERIEWEQQIPGTPFERYLRAAETEVLIEPDGAGSRVRLSRTLQMRGISRLGSLFARRGAARILDRALAALDDALTGGTGTLEGGAA